MLRDWIVGYDFYLLLVFVDGGCLGIESVVLECWFLVFWKFYMVGVGIGERIDLGERGRVVFIVIFCDCFDYFMIFFWKVSDVLRWCVCKLVR